MTRIQLIGSSGAGKTTLGRSLASRLCLPFVDLDDLYWEPVWREVGHEELARRLGPIAAREQWIIAGNYHATTEPQLWPRLTHLVVLDLPYAQLLRRCLWRTLQRGLLGTPCCNGNHESLRRLFHRDGVVRYLSRTWRRRHVRYATLHGDPALAHVEVVHLTSQRAVRRWLDRQSA